MSRIPYFLPGLEWKRNWEYFQITWICDFNKLQFLSSEISFKIFLKKNKTKKRQQPGAQHLIIWDELFLSFHSLHRHTALWRGRSAQKTIHFKWGHKSHFTCLSNRARTERANPANHSRCYKEPQYRGSHRFCQMLNLGQNCQHCPGSDRRKEAEAVSGAVSFPGTKEGIQSIHSITFTFSRDFFLIFP